MEKTKADELIAGSDELNRKKKVVKRTLSIIKSWVEKYSKTEDFILVRGSMGAWGITPKTTPGSRVRIKFCDNISDLLQNKSLIKNTDEEWGLELTCRLYYSLDDLLEQIFEELPETLDEYLALTSQS